jgi:hypothetical protein
MTAPLRHDESRLSKREETTVSAAAMSGVPWRAAGATGVAVAGADMLVHLLGGGLGLSSSLSAGTVALFAVAGAGAVLRKQPGRAARWARQHPWRFAVLPGAAAAVIVFVLSVLVGSSWVVGGAFTALWHGAIAYGITGAAGAVAGSRRGSGGRAAGG